MSVLGSVSQLLEQLRAGDEQALGVLMRRYWPFLVARAGERLPAAYRRAADADDVVQQVWCAIYQGFEDGRWQQLANRQDLVALLNEITTCKAINQLQHELRQKRGGGAVTIGLPDDSEGAVAPGLSPSHLIMEEEWWQHCISRLPDDLRAVAELLRDGHTQEEIAAKLHCSVRTVVRKVSLLRVKWLQMPV
jgi:DNA-directed RNA polymerase specialized sigma24 family protein